jgi:hypothetical protein
MHMAYGLWRMGRVAISYKLFSCPLCAPLKTAAGWSDATPELVTPERFNRGSSLNFAWIPAKSMRE